MTTFFLTLPNGMSTSVQVERDLSFETIRAMTGYPSAKYCMSLKAEVWDSRRHAMRTVLIRTQNSLSALVNLQRQSPGCINDFRLKVIVKAIRRKRTNDQVKYYKKIARKNKKN